MIFISIVFLRVYDFVALATISAVIGFFKTFLHLPAPIVFAEYLPKERYAISDFYLSMLISIIGLTAYFDVFELAAYFS